MRKLLGVVVLLSAGPVLADYPPKAALTRLEEGMPMETVRKLFGEPDETDSGTCGTATKNPWRCRSWRYITPREGPPKVLNIRFRKDDESGWVVNSWETV